MTGSKVGTVGKYNPIRYRGYVYDTETQLYYLNTRYYNPDMCRFINADGYVSTGQGLTGSNMFAYCGNNPVNRLDPAGEITYSIGIGGSAAFVGGGSYSISIVVDYWGNIGIQRSTSDIMTLNSGANFGTPSAGLSISCYKTNLESIYDLEGIGTNFGASVSKLGVDFVFDESLNVIGKGFSTPICGTPLPELHINATKTETLCSINLMELYPEQAKMMIGLLYILDEGKKEIYFGWLLEMLGIGK